MGGSFKWICSERQYADGLTKEATRQLLADRIHHGKTKFTWDPLYTAAKKKLSERNQSRGDFTTPNFNSISNNNTISKKFKERKGHPEGMDSIAEEEPMNVEETEKPSFGSYYADGDDVIEYVNAAKLKQVPAINPVEDEVPKNVEAIVLRGV